MGTYTHLREATLLVLLLDLRRGVFFGRIREKSHEVAVEAWSMDFSLSTYYPIFLYLLAILAFAVGSLVAAHLIGPRKKTPVKLMPYESGMDPIGDAHQHFDVKFYLIAILFLVFDVELLFLYPWAVATYRNEGGVDLIDPAFRNPIFWEILVFLATLALGYVYAWRKGVFKWR